MCSSDLFPSHDSCDGKEIKDIDDLILYLSQNKVVGDHVVLKINRDGKIIEITAELGTRPSK